MSSPSVQINSTYVPALPNTGFEPIDATMIAFSVVLLMSAAVLAYPYVRRAFIAISQ